MKEFFLPMIPPTATAQMRQVRIVPGRGGKPIPQFYEPPIVAEARGKLTAHLAKHAPATPWEGPLQLVVKWCYPLQGKHLDGEYRTSRPDTDNLQKLLKDVLTGLGYWHDDAQVASEVAEKFWAQVPGLYVGIRRLGPKAGAGEAIGAPIVSQCGEGADRRTGAKFEAKSE